MVLCHRIAPMPGDRGGAKPGKRGAPWHVAVVQTSTFGGSGRQKAHTSVDPTSSFLAPTRRKNVSSHAPDEVSCRRMYRLSARSRT